MKQEQQKKGKKGIKNLKDRFFLGFIAV